MRREYDFSEGVRGKHKGQRLRIVGDKETKQSATAMKIQQIIERDLKRRQNFGHVWNQLNQTERKSIRAAWLRKINTVLEAKPLKPSNQSE